MQVKAGPDPNRRKTMPKIVDRLPAGVCLVLLILVGCAPNIEAPELRVDGVRVGGIGLSGGTVFVRLNLANPNSVDLAASSVTYDIDLRGEDDWLDLTEGTLDETLTLAREDSLELEIPVEFTYRRLGPVFRSLLDHGRVDYRLSGEVALVRPLRTRVPFRREGVVGVTGDG